MNQQPAHQLCRRGFLAGAAGATTGWLTARAFSALADGGEPLRVCLVSGSLEYESDASLAGFQEYVESNYSIRCARAFRRTDDDLPGLENLETCDVALFYTRRLTIDGEQLQRVKDYCAAGRPIVGVRTASHGFQNWLEMDREVFGGDYGNHYSRGPRTQIEIADEAKSHPILAGFEPFASVGSLYRNRNIAADTTVLLRGQIPEHVEPIAWTRMHHGGRVFYTSLGHQQDFLNDSFLALLANAVLWTAGQRG